MFSVSFGQTDCDALCAGWGSGSMDDALVLVVKNGYNNNSTDQILMRVVKL